MGNQTVKFVKNQYLYSTSSEQDLQEDAWMIKTFGNVSPRSKHWFINSENLPPNENVWYLVNADTLSNYRILTDTGQSNKPEFKDVVFHIECLSTYSFKPLNGDPRHAVYGLKWTRK